MRYSAFISYNHKDEAHARWLRRALEGYRIPRHLRQYPAQSGAVAVSGQRLKPVFRDRDEVTPAADLGQVVRDAIEAASALIVICSPDGARSKWVNAEIRQFTALGRRDRIFCIIVGGDPMSADPERECFPAALFDDGAPEPLCADIRPHRDSRDDARLKMIASVLGLGFDELRQRELRRQKQRWTAFGIASLALSTVFALLAWQAIVARDAARAAQARAEMEASTSRQTADFMVSLFEVSEPGEARGNTITAREVLDRGVERIESVRINKPLVKSRLLGTMGQVYTGLGIYHRAEELLLLAEKQVSDRGAGPEESAQRFDVQWELADLLYAMGEYERSREVLARTTISADASGAAERRARLANLEGDLAWQDGDDDRARSRYEQALTELGSDETKEPVQRARALGGLGRMQLLGPHPASSIPLLEAAYRALAAHFGRDHPDTLVVLNLRASAAYRSGDSGSARKLWTEALASGRKVYGERHPEVATFLSNLALLELEDGRFKEAEQMFRETVDIDRNVRVEGFDELAYTLNNLALARAGQGDTAEAGKLLEEARDIALAHKHPMLGPILANLADLRCSTGRREDGLRLAADAIEANRTEYGPDHWRSRQSEIVAAACGAPPTEAVRSGEALRTIVARWGEKNLYARRALELAGIIPRGS